MSEQQSSWKGAYYINVSSVGKNDQGSILIQEAEECLCANCTYKKGLIQRLIDDEEFQTIMLKE